MTDTQDDCHKKNEFKPSPYVLRSYAKDMDKDTRLIDGDIAPYLRKVAAWIEQQNASRPSAAGDVSGELLRTIIANDVLIRNMRHRDARWHDDPDVQKVLTANTAIIQAASNCAMPPAPLNVGELVALLEKQRLEHDLHISASTVEEGNRMLDNVLALIRKWADGGKL